MVRVVFRNLAKKETLQSLIQSKLDHVLSKFPGLETATTTVTLGLEHSPLHAGQDLFHAKVILLSRGLRPIVLEKVSDNPFSAVAMLSDRLFEVLHRALDRRRERSRSERRRWKMVG